MGSVGATSVRSGRAGDVCGGSRDRHDPGRPAWLEESSRSRVRACLASCSAVHCLVLRSSHLDPVARHAAPISPRLTACRETLPRVRGHTFADRQPTRDLPRLRRALGNGVRWARDQRVRPGDRRRTVASLVRGVRRLQLEKDGGRRYRAPCHSREREQGSRARGERIRRDVASAACSPGVPCRKRLDHPDSRMAGGMRDVRSDDAPGFDARRGRGSTDAGSRRNSVHFVACGLRAQLPGHAIFRRWARREGSRERPACAAALPLVRGGP